MILLTPSRYDGPAAAGSEMVVLSSDPNRNSFLQGPGLLSSGEPCRFPEDRIQVFVKLIPWKP